tara:strand:+ start:3654 stop:5432 length:1779 start_codon:yes stop_codon:yes gene_type:complete
MYSQKTLSALTASTCAAALAASIYLGGVAYTPGQPDRSGFVHRYAPDYIAECALHRTVAFGGEGSNSRAWQACRHEFARTQTYGQFNRRYWATSSSAIALLLSLFWLGPALRRGHKAPKVVRGRSYYRGGEARRKLEKASRKDCKTSGSAMEFPKGIPFAWDRENRHMMIWGGVGSGKTQIMLNLMDRIIARGDKMLVLDTKGDMTASLGAPFTLIAPQDARSHVWNVAADCTTKQDARELAAKLIPEGHDRIWSDAARTVLTACLCKLLGTQPGKWTWEDLRASVTSDLATLRETATDYYPQALHILSEDGGRTTQSVLTTLQSHMQAVSALADAWGVSDGKTFSVTDWIASPGYEPPLVLQYDGKYPDLSNAWISSMVATLSGIVSSPTFTEDSGRRIWLFLDEFPQLDELKHFSTLLDTGRSKGLCVVIGMQDFAQLRDTYGNHKADAWLGMIGTHVMTRMSLGRSADEACRLMGLQEIEIVQRTENRQNGTVTYSNTVRTETRPVVTGADLAGNLGPYKKGIRAIILGPGKDVYEIDFPFVTLAQKRSAASPADWTMATPAKLRAKAARQVPQLSKADLARIRKPRPS